MSNSNSSSNMCFACGQDNPIGLKLDFEVSGNIYRTNFTPSDIHQSYDGMMHGGLMCTLLDEVMGHYLSFVKRVFAPTAELNVRFKKPAKINKKMLIEGEVVNERGRLIEMKATAKNEEGKVIAEAIGKFIKSK